MYILVIVYSVYFHEFKFRFQVSGNFEYQAPVVGKVDNTIHQINCYPVDKC